ncbi:hypothetical protein Pla86_49590 [Planctomycetes bacterium Pla86]|uniref:Uncharacterized protein n=2 Tax=Engelhardtia mirabilis TaxID=2528011 RepID=A0A518BS92_9BACT|nr:hypothetical protein Pla133_49610 [Planctomycetes bacterium Pla133]QDV04164.1 hypothetical protein Pla86_49590 [Planctomycetes bacterium Pla86]
MVAAIAASYAISTFCAPTMAMSSDGSNESDRAARLEVQTIGSGLNLPSIALTSAATTGEQESKIGRLLKNWQDCVAHPLCSDEEAEKHKKALDDEVEAKENGSGGGSGGGDGQ